MTESFNKEKILAAMRTGLLGGLEALSEQMKTGYLLLFMDFGVLWGKINNGKILDPFSENSNVKNDFKINSLQQAHCFNSEKEVRIWHSSADFELCVLSAQEEVNGIKIIEQKYLLWGSSSGKSMQYEEYREGKRGIAQSIPFQAKRDQRVGLVVIHRLDVDGDGQCYIQSSRLAGLEAWEVNNETKA